MADLKRLRPAEKGNPPAPAQLTENLAKPPRDADEPKARLEFSVPESVFNAFSEEAARRYGHKRGSKVQLFMAMWEETISRKSG